MHTYEDQGVCVSLLMTEERAFKRHVGVHVHGCQSEEKREKRCRCNRCIEIYAMNEKCFWLQVFVTSRGSLWIHNLHSSFACTQGAKRRSIYEQPSQNDEVFMLLQKNSISSFMNVSFFCQMSSTRFRRCVLYTKGSGACRWTNKNDMSRVLKPLFSLNEKTQPWGCGVTDVSYMLTWAC